MSLRLFKIFIDYKSLLRMIIDTNNNNNNDNNNNDC